MQVVRYTGTAENLTIPEEVNNGSETYKVTAIANWAFASLTGEDPEVPHITIPNSVNQYW